MKQFVVFVGLVFAVALPSARAQQSSDDQYIAIYNMIEQGDSLQDAGQPRQALSEYVQARDQLAKFKKTSPDWDPKIISYRMNYLAGKINSLSAQLPEVPAPTNAPSAVIPVSAAPVASTSTAPVAPAAPANVVPSQDADLQAQLNALQLQLQGSQSANETLQEKLREALSVQPVMPNTQELAQAQEQVRSLMKENDLLQATLKTQASSNVEPAVESGELSTLRARLAVDEAQTVPYTPEELALFKTSPSSTNAASGAGPNPISELPNGSSLLAAEAQDYFSDKQYDKAEADYQKILANDPNNALVLANLATIEMDEGKLADAEKHINAALAQTPNDAYDLSTLGNLKFHEGKYDAAFDALSRAAKLDPQNPEIQNYLGVTLSHKGLRAQAENALRRAIELDPNYGAAHNNLAVIYINEQPPLVELARWHYQKALDNGEPRNPGLEKSLAENGAPVNAQ